MTQPVVPVQCSGSSAASFSATAFATAHVSAARSTRVCTCNRLCLKSHAHMHASERFISRHGSKQASERAGRSVDWAVRARTLGVVAVAENGFDEIEVGNHGSRGDEAHLRGLLLGEALDFGARQRAQQQRAEDLGLLLLRAPRVHVEGLGVHHACARGACMKCVPFACNTEGAKYGLSPLLSAFIRQYAKLFAIQCVHVTEAQLQPGIVQTVHVRHGRTNKSHRVARRRVNLVESTQQTRTPTLLKARNKLAPGLRCRAGSGAPWEASGPP
jgi:hypothetical protein